MSQEHNFDLPAFRDVPGPGDGADLSRRPPLAEWPACPDCGLGERITARKGGFYRCNQCKEDFTVRTGTIFERSHVPLHKWIYAMYLIVTARKGISSMQLAKEIGITQKSAWFILGGFARLAATTSRRCAASSKSTRAIIGGKEKNKHEDKKLKPGRGTVGKTAVLGMRERGGRTKAKPVKRHGCQRHSRPKFAQHIEAGFDDPHRRAWRVTPALAVDYHARNDLSGAGEYVRDGVTTNGIESVWAVLKRGLLGVYHHASPKHLHRYVDEFTFRLNEGNVKRHTMTGWTASLRRYRQAAHLQGFDQISPSVPKPPELLEKIVDMVLAYRPKPKSQAAKKRRDQKTKVQFIVIASIREQCG